MLRKKAVLKFLGKHAGRRPLLPGLQLTAWNVLKKNFIKDIFLQPIWNYSQLLSYPSDNCDQLPVKLPCLLHGNTSLIQIVMFLNVIICDAYNCQNTLINIYISIWSLWYLISFFFPVGSFFQPKKALNLNHGLSYLSNLHLLVPLPLLESKDQE